MTPSPLHLAVHDRTGDAVRQFDAARKALDAAMASIASALAAPAIDDDANQLLAAALKTAHADLEAARAELKAEREHTVAARAETARMTEEFESVLDEFRKEHATAIGQQAVAYTSLPLDELLTIFNTLKRSATLTEVLTNLVEGIAREFSRVARFDVCDNRLEGAQQVGFAFESDISKVLIPLSVESLLSRAVSSGRLETYFSGLHDDPGASIPFGGTPTCAVAIPILVQGETIAIIYADDSDKPEFASGAPHIRVKFAELLQQHALLVLLRVWTEHKSLSEVREFTRLLVNEIERAHTADVNAGKNALERQQGLKDNLERARRIYAERIAREDHTAATLLQERLSAVVDGRRDTAFGQDLAAILGSASRAPRASVLTMPRR